MQKEIKLFWNIVENKALPEVIFNNYCKIMKRYNLPSKQYYKLIIIAGNTGCVYINNYARSYNNYRGFNNL